MFLGNRARLAPEVLHDAAVGPQHQAVRLPAVNRVQVGGLAVGDDGLALLLRRYGQQVACQQRSHQRLQLLRSHSQRRQRERRLPARSALTLGLPGHHRRGHRRRPV
ncbi:hypothetical protein TSOC_006394 [Tetrabaena socialis]|uniref:Uncharacterized protein n=1 Tax=Tetrabaena socialis TaxID=47790 RepID=A0A2J8A3S3_9CHLO|nr:hypothetical protein TSOC_006394 [Tetrabaena socialis]|eukprot:PNH07157.1 hypothetical protein TSOC_006394 [Tetrabaena socialis]